MKNNFDFNKYLKKNPLLKENTDVEEGLSMIGDEPRFSTKSNDPIMQMLADVPEMAYASMKTPFDQVVKGLMKKGWTRQDITGFFGALVAGKLERRGSMREEEGMEEGWREEGLTGDKMWAAIDKEIEDEKMALRMNPKIQRLAQALGALKARPFDAAQLTRVLKRTTPKQFEAAADMADFYYDTIQSDKEYNDADYEVLEGGYQDEGAAISYVDGKFNRIG